MSRDTGLDHLPSGDGTTPRPLTLTCRDCGWRGPISDAAQPCIDKGHRLIGRNGQIQHFSPSWRQKSLNTSEQIARCETCGDDCPQPWGYAANGKYAFCSANCRMEYERSMESGGL